MLLPLLEPVYFLLQLSSIFGGTNIFFCFHVISCWNHCITFATNVLIFFYYRHVDLLHPFFHEVKETHSDEVTETAQYASTGFGFCWNPLQKMLQPAVVRSASMV
ncbi:hypothetical protein VPH35_053403 [Triticum aestivum]